MVGLKEQLNWNDARTVFKAKIRMIKITANFKGTNEEMTCKRCTCNKESDSHKHMIR